MNRRILGMLLNGQNRRSNGQYAMDGERGRRSRDGRQRGDYGHYDDYDSRYGFEYNSDRSEGAISREELEEWRRRLGGKFSLEQAERLARQIGVNFEHFTPEEFAVVMNMVYSDFSEALRKSGVPERPELYAQLAKAWLCDEDFEGEPYEKLALYYYAIAGE